MTRTGSVDGRAESLIVIEDIVILQLQLAWLQYKPRVLVKNIEEKIYHRTACASFDSFDEVVLVGLLSQSVLLSAESETLNRKTFKKVGLLKRRTFKKWDF